MHTQNINKPNQLPNNTVQYNTIQLYCQVTNAHGICYGTKHSYKHIHISHIKKKNCNSKNIKVVQSTFSTWCRWSQLTLCLRIRLSVSSSLSSITACAVSSHSSSCCCLWMSDFHSLANPSSFFSQSLAAVTQFWKSQNLVTSTSLCAAE